MNELNVTLYSTHCPQCTVLENILDNKKIPVTVVYGADEISKLGYQSAPILKVNDTIMTFAEAIHWVNGYGGGADGT